MIPQYVMIPNPVILGYTLSRALKADAEFRFRFAYAWRAHKAEAEFRFRYAHRCRDFTPHYTQTHQSNNISIRIYLLSAFTICTILFLCFIMQSAYALG
jgi:hypothetical protein